MTIDVLDLFCGCGGTSLGFKNARSSEADYRIIGGVDIDPHALATYSANVKAPAINCDLSAITKSGLQELLQQTLRRKENPLFLIGCAPCQAFSSHTKKAVAGDERKSLLPKLAEIAYYLNPDAILIENVPELLADRSWEFFTVAKKKLEKAGYIVRARIYNFAEFGLPQERFRTVIMAFKAPFEMPLGFLKPESFRTVRSAIGHLPLLKAGNVNEGDPMHITSNHRPSTLQLISQVPKDGGNRKPGTGPKCLDDARGSFGGYTDVYGRLWWDRPAVTITARCRTPSCGRFTHPEQNRGLSVREAALLQGFPEKSIFVGPFDDKYKQIGNAVPPLVAKALAKHLASEFARIQRRDDVTMDDQHRDVQKSIGPGFSILINGIKKRRASQSVLVSH
jgi:DNA (cytosine-5)-methyltransferase 1